MSESVIIGLHHNENDPFWVQVEETIYQAAESYPVQIVPIAYSVSGDVADNKPQLTIVDELLALEVHAVMGWWLPEKWAIPVLDAGLPIVHLSETDVVHPLSVSPRGLYEVGRMAASFLAQRLDGRGNVYVVGGLLKPILQDDGRSRMEGIRDAFSEFPGIHFQHIPSDWTDAAYAQISAAFRQLAPRRIDGLIGLSDSQALLARQAAVELCMMNADTLVVGINGDPLALSAISRGEMVASVETDPCVHGTRALDLAVRAARREPLPAHYAFEHRLVTSENVAGVAAKRLLATATLPSRFLDGIRRIEQQHRVQVQASLSISHRLGSLLDAHALTQEIADIIRLQYGYDRVFFYRWSEAEHVLVLESPPTSAEQATIISLGQGNLLAQAFLSDDALFIPNTQRSLRFSPDPLWPDTYSRIVLPIGVGGVVIGLLDLHSTQANLHLGREQLTELRSLADQFGIVMHNVQRYETERKLRESVELVGRLQTNLLSNFGQEMRPPLLSIRENARYLQQNRDLPPANLLNVIENIQRNTDRILQMADALLSLSQIETNEHPPAMEMVDVRLLLVHAVQSEVTRAHPAQANMVKWELPDRLPLLTADPIRLRQVLTYLARLLLAGCSQCEIVVGATVEVPWVQIYINNGAGSVGASGSGASDAQQIGVDSYKWRHRLDLALVQRTLMLHGGGLIVQDGGIGGETFKIRLPLPTLLDRPAAAAQPTEGNILFVVGVDADIIGLADECMLPLQSVRHVRGCAELENALRDAEPQGIVYDGLSAGGGDWDLLLSIRRSPRLQRLPFLLYAMPTSGENSPVPGRNLTAAIASLCPDVTGKTVLIMVNDSFRSTEYQALMERSLPGVPVRFVNDNADLRREAQLMLPALIILDSWRVDTDSDELLDDLRAVERLRQTAVLLLTADTPAAVEITHLNESGPVILCGSDILAPDELAVLIQRVLANRELLPAHTSSLVKQAIVYLQRHFAEAISRSDVASSVGVSESYLSQIFRQEIGISLWEYLSRCRIRQAKHLLHHTTLSVTEVACTVGIQDPAYFSRTFHKQLGMSPSAYRVAFQKTP